jgi:F0F1-type ATP synthase alpha subunit
MAIKASEISDLIKARIEKFASASEERNIGTVVTVTDGIVRIHGLADVKYGEMLEFPGGSFGLGRARRVQAHHRGRHGEDHRPHSRSAGR